MRGHEVDSNTSASRGRYLWSWSLHRRTQFVLDLVILAAAFGLAYLLRFDFQVPERARSFALVQLPLVVLLQFATLLLLRIYNFVWRYVGIREIATFLRAALFSALPLAALRLGLSDSYQAWRVPLSVIVVDTVLAFGGLLAVRVLRRVLYERYERDVRSVQAGAEGRTKPVLLVGAGRAGILAVREIQNRGDMDLVAVGFVDDDPLKQGMVIHGVRVLGTSADIPELARRLPVDHVILTMVDAGPEAVRRIVGICERERLKVRTVPGLYEVLAGKVSISRFRDIEIEDLLGRDPVELEEELLQRFLSGKRVLVSGAGGSIGSELARQIARFEPQRLVLLERAEGALFEIDRELRKLWPKLHIDARVADVCDSDRLDHVLGDARPEVIFHAAAHKHVPLMEKNPAEAIRNNVFGTLRLGAAAGRHGVEAFILISTDKAVRPTSVMGASKRMAELVVQKLDGDYPATRFLAVRFGNVLDSAGSVIRIFRDQINHGGPVTVTHPDMRRYFMTIPEASQLVLQAGAMGEGAEIFVLDMGQPVKILDLAEKMIRLSGFEPDLDIPIHFSGMRPGEKLFEEIELEGEDMSKTRHPKIFVGRLHPQPSEWIDAALTRLRALARSGRPEEVRAALGELVPESDLGGLGGEIGAETDSSESLVEAKPATGETLAPQGSRARAAS